MADSVTQWAWGHSRSRNGARLVLLAIAHDARDDGMAWPTIRELEGKTALSTRAVQGALRDLKELGELTVTSEPDYISRYQVNMTAGAAPEPDIWDVFSADPAVAPTGKRRSKRPNVSHDRMRAMRLAVYERDGYACVQCGWKPNIPEGYAGWYALCGPAPATNEPRAPSQRLAKTRVLHLDHVVPYSRGGQFVLGNLQALCSTCNSRKGARV